MSDFLRWIQLGLVPEENEPILAAVIIAAFILFFFMFSIIARWVEQLRYTRRGLRKFEELIRKYDLTIREIDFLKIMSAYLSTTGKIYQLLQNILTFRNCLKEMKRQGYPVDEDLAARIAGKAFDTSVIYSEAAEKVDILESLKPGKTVYLFKDLNGRKKRECIVKQRRGRYLYIHAPSKVFRRREDVRIFIPGGSDPKESARHIVNGEVVRTSPLKTSAVIRLHHVKTAPLL